MSSDVVISFRSRIEAGESTFMVPVQRKFVDQPNRRFGLESITLMPEYQNTQAYAYKLDSIAELESKTRNPIQLEVVYGANYFQKEEKKTWSYLTRWVRINEILLSLNQFYDQNKPPGTLYPAVFFDWVHLLSFDEGETIRDYQRSTAEDAYGEAFSEEKHNNWLPPSLVKFEQFNTCVFPTADNEEYLDDIRIRMWVAPNTKITFSNQELPLALGLNESQIPEKTKRGQIEFENTNVFEYKRYFAMDSPLINPLVDKLRGVKVNAYVSNSYVLSSVAVLETNKQRERDPTLLCEDYAVTVKNLASSINLVMSLEYNKNNSKKFTFNYPANENISVKVYLPNVVLKQLGFDTSMGEYILPTSVSSQVLGEIVIDEYEKKALALVYDTGMVTIDLYEQHSQLSSHSGNTLMATLHPKKDGTLRNRIHFNDVPRVHVSSTNPDMKFVLYRFDDNNKKFYLGWPVGAYIFGTLTGKV